MSYQYTVGGKEYASGNEKPWDWKLRKEVIDAANPDRRPDWSWSGQVQAGNSRVAYGRQEWAEAESRKYVRGNHCLAYYNPANPSEAFLLHEYDFAPYKGTFLAAFFFLGSLFIIVASYARWQAGTLNSNGPLKREEYRTVGRWLCIPGLAVLGGCVWLLLHFLHRSHDPLTRSRAPLVVAVVVGLLVCMYVGWLVCMYRSILGQARYGERG